jgi:hypothetical protein
MECIVMAVSKKDIQIVSMHNWNEFEEVKNDLLRETLKLRLVYDYIGNKGFTAEADGILGEVVGNMEQYTDGAQMFYECVEDGLVFNPD